MLLMLVELSPQNKQNFVQDSSLVSIVLSTTNLSAVDSSVSVLSLYSNREKLILQQFLSFLLTSEADIFPFSLL